MNVSLQAPFFKFLKRAVAGAILCTGFITAVSLKPEEGEFKTYVDQNLEQLIQQQEEVIGIKYPKEFPRIQYSLPPDIAKTGAAGNYDYETNTIFLQSSYLEPPEWDFSAAKDALHHELAHYYMDRLSEQVSNQDYPYYEDDTSLTQMIGIKLISEGTARYVENRMNGQVDTFTDNDWPKTIQGFVFHPWMPFPKLEIIYEGGFHLVKPIIDQHGEKGIKYLMAHPPEEQDLLSLPLYQQRMLEELAEHG